MTTTTKSLIRPIPTSESFREENLKNDLLERAEKAAKAALNENLMSESSIIKELADENMKMRNALWEISWMGRVCPEFEICKHDYCKDSSGAYLVALNTLNDLGLRVSLDRPMKE